MLFQITKALDEAFPSTKFRPRFYVTQIIETIKFVVAISLDDV